MFASTGDTSPLCGVPLSDADPRMLRILRRFLKAEFRGSMSFKVGFIRYPCF